MRTCGKPALSQNRTGDGSHSTRQQPRSLLGPAACVHTVRRATSDDATSAAVVATVPLMLHFHCAFAVVAPALETVASFAAGSRLGNAVEGRGAGRGVLDGRGGVGCDDHDEHPGITLNKLGV